MPTPDGWTPLISSNLSAYRYDPNTATLSIRFTSGTTYDYSPVPPNVPEELDSAASPGQYFNSAIKDQFKTAWKKK